MKKIFAIIAAVFIMGINFLYPINANAAVSNVTHVADFDIDTDLYYYVCFDYYNSNFNKYQTLCIKWRKDSTDLSETFYIDNGVNYYPIASTCLYTERNTYDGATTANSYFDANNRSLQADFTNETFSVLKSDGTVWNRWTGQLLAYEDNLPDPNSVNLSFTFNPSMTGAVSRDTVVNGINYTSDKFQMQVTNNGANAQFAMFIVNHGDNITIPALQWDSSDIYVGSPVFTYVKDEWIDDSLTPNNTSISYMPSLLHYVGASETKTYEIAWSSLMLTANTSYDVVVYAALPDSQNVSLDTSLTYSEVYRSTFSMVNPATFNPENTITDNYSWDNTHDNKDLFSLKKATQDEWGNFAVYGNGNWLGNTQVNSSLNTQQAFGSFFQFLRSIFSFFPAQYLTLLFIGLSALVVIGIVKAVSH